MSCLDPFRKHRVIEFVEFHHLQQVGITREVHDLVASRVAQFAAVEDMDVTAIETDREVAIRWRRGVGALDDVHRVELSAAVQAQTRFCPHCHQFKPNGDIPRSFLSASRVSGVNDGKPFVVVR